MIVLAPTKYSERFAKSLKLLYLFGCEENLVDATEKGSTSESSHKEVESTQEMRPGSEEKEQEDVTMEGVEDSGGGFG